MNLTRGTWKFELLGLLLLALVIAAGNARAAECNGVYHGFVQGELPQPPYFGHVIDGTLSDFYDDGESAYLVVNGELVRIQHPNLLTISFNNFACAFGGMYDADPLFHASMEKTL